jgi:predicted MPP superfamily phosphohydrolase
MNEVLFLFIILFIIGVILLIYMLKEAFSNRVIFHELEFSSFPKSFGKVHVFFISDIHRRHISDKVINEVKGKVDVVIIGGDLMEKGVPFERVKGNLLKLKTLGPVFFVWGNNDYEVEVPLLDAMLLNLGIKQLVDSSMLFESVEGERISIIGLDVLRKERNNLESALQEVDSHSFKILVSHYPDISRKIQPEHGISLLLSGHTHGGQIRLFGYSPYEKGGVKKAGDVICLISNGYGTTGVPLRLGAKSETHLLSIGSSETT